jgi:hypothetical protein
VRCWAIFIRTNAGHTKQEVSELDTAQKLLYKTKHIPQRMEWSVIGFNFIEAAEVRAEAFERGHPLRDAGCRGDRRGENLKVGKAGLERARHSQSVPLTQLRSWLSFSCLCP